MWIEFSAGFLIAVTGVGAGVFTVPILILFLHIPADVAVGTALLYSAIVKFIVAPVQMLRRQVDYHVLGFMLIGGLPGVLTGSLLFNRIVRRGALGVLYWALGLIIIFSSSWHTSRHFFFSKFSSTPTNRSHWLTLLMFPVGADVGFTSTGAGALGMTVLLNFTSLNTSQAIGTDLVFGLCVTSIGGGIHVISGAYDATLLARMLAGGIAGAILGISVAPSLPGRPLRFALSLWLLALGIELCCRAARL